MAVLQTLRQYGALGDRSIKHSPIVSTYADTYGIGLIEAQFVERGLLHGLAQGGLSVAQGAKFKEAFLSAAFSVIAGGALKAGGLVKGHFDQLVSRTIIGGTAATLGGGKFANGAATAAFVYVFNDCAHSDCFGIKPGKITISMSVNSETGKHSYSVLGALCTRSQQGCTSAWADQAFGSANGRDVPFTFDDLGSGPRNLLPWLPRPLGNQPIRHDEYIANRTSVNTTEPSHIFHPGTVTHSVYFSNDTLYYEVTGVGTGAYPTLNNIAGVALFAPGVKNIVDRYGRQ